MKKFLLIFLFPLTCFADAPIYTPIINQNTNSGSSYTLPAATTSTLGGVIPDGTTITVDGTGHISSTGGSPVSTGLIPTMTANTTPYGIASASSIASAGNDAYKAMDGNGSSFWSPAGSVATNWVQYQLTNAAIITSYTVTLFATKAFILQGSSDGVNFINLDAESTAGGTFSINNSTAWLYYRLTTTTASPAVEVLQINGYYATPVQVGIPQVNGFTNVSTSIALQTIASQAIAAHNILYLTNFGASMSISGFNNDIALSNAIQTAYSLGGGTIIIPAGTNADGTTSICMLTNQATISPNADNSFGEARYTQVHFPFRDLYTGAPITINIEGAYPPVEQLTWNNTGSAQPISNSGSIIEFWPISEHSGAGVGNQFGMGDGFAAGTGSSIWHFNNIIVTLKNLIIRSPIDPRFMVCNFTYTGQAEVDHCVFDTTNSFANFPSTFGNFQQDLTMPTVNNWARNSIRDVDVLGASIGVRFSEHVIMDDIRIMDSYIAFQVGGNGDSGAPHDCDIGRTLVQGCATSIVVQVSSPFSINWKNYDVERTTLASGNAQFAWQYTGVTDLVDPNSYMHGLGTRNCVISGIGQTNLFVVSPVNTGTNMNWYDLVTDTWDFLQTKKFISIFTQTNFISNQIYNNITGSKETVYSDEFIVSAALGNTGFRLLYDPAGGTAWQTNDDGVTVQVAASIVGMTNPERLVGPIPAGASFVWSNFSTVGSATLRNGFITVP